MMIRNIYNLLQSVIKNGKVEVSGISGGGGNNIFEKGSAELTSATYYDVAFSEPRANYLPYVSLASSGSIVAFNITNITSNGFRVEFSAPFTGTIYYCIVI